MRQLTGGIIFGLFGLFGLGKLLFLGIHRYIG